MASGLDFGDLRIDLDGVRATVESEALDSIRSESATHVVAPRARRIRGQGSAGTHRRCVVHDAAQNLTVLDRRGQPIGLLRLYGLNNRDLTARMSVMMARPLPTRLAPD